MLLDIGVGIILGIGASVLSDNYSLAVFVGIGIFSTLSPDIDYIYHLLRGGSTKDDHRHREILHNPLLLLIGGLLIWVFISLELAILFTVGAISHFIHDSIGIGWGVQWLYPLTSNHYSFFYIAHTAKQKPKPPKRLIYIWPDDQIDKLQEKYGDPNWFENTYLKWHPFAIFELIVFIISLLALWLATH
jgi:hypothetical protein